jgi:transcriptional regulator with XRE-family HTH domain
LIPPREAFGPTLRAARERKGLSLQAIADSTKINAALLAALERSDVSRWPKGIFGRAFLREYAAATGLPPEPTVAEFIRLFPEDPTGHETADTANEFRLTLAVDTLAAHRTAAKRVVVALVELSGVLLVGAIAAWLLEADWLKMSGVIGLIYYPLAARCLGHRKPLRSLLDVTFPSIVRDARGLSASAGALFQLLCRLAISTRRLRAASSNKTAPAPGLRTVSN